MNPDELRARLDRYRKRAEDARLVLEDEEPRVCPKCKSP